MNDHGSMDRLLAELVDAVGAEHVLTDADVRAGYETDWTGRYRGTAVAVVRPGSTEEVVRVVRAAATRGAAIVTQGGNTGLVGGSVPGVDDRPWVVVSTRRLTRTDPVDVGAAQVTLGAGVTLAAWRDHARAAGLDAPVDFASRDSATVGGAVATNAGGSRVVRFGTMRAQVTGIEAVLADGSVVGSLAGLPKETVGVHLPSWFSGSEGTFGVITAVRLRCVPWYRSTVTAMVTTASLAEAVGLLGRLRGSVPSLDQVELVLPEAMELVAGHLGHEPPVAIPGPLGAAVVIEAAAHVDPTDQLTDALSEASEVVDAAVTTGGPAREQLLAFRDRITEAINAVAVPFKLDVAVPVDRLDELLGLARTSVARHGGRLVPFGHLAEGNVHLNVVPVERDGLDRDGADPGPIDTGAIAAEVLPAVAAMGGTISAEHGVGRAKVPWVGLVRTPADRALLQSLKDAVDPAGVLNPGVLLPGPAATDPS